MILSIFVGLIDYLMNEEGRIYNMLTNTIINQNEPSLSTTVLGSTRTVEEEYREQELLNIAETWLNRRGIATRTLPCGDDQYFRHSYDILVDLGKYLEESHVKQNCPCS